VPVLPYGPARLRRCSSVRRQASAALSSMRPCNRTERDTQRGPSSACYSSTGPTPSVASCLFTCPGVAVSSPLVAERNAPAAPLWPLPVALAWRCQRRAQGGPRPGSGEKPVTRVWGGTGDGAMSALRACACSRSRQGK
jgi:hypothetical protein